MPGSRSGAMNHQARAGEDGKAPSGLGVKVPKHTETACSDRRSTSIQS